MITVSKLFFSYSKGTDTLRNLSFTVSDGERVGIIGPNGAGKTTLFHILCGILTPQQGTVSINGRPVVPNSFNPDIGYIFQNPDDQLFSATVFEDIAFGPLNQGLDRAEVIARVDEALTVTGCGCFKDRPPHHLSGGEKRMAAIASVIAMKPRIIIYDEPSSNLDMRARRNLINFINSSSGTALVSSHDLEFVLETCTRVLILDAGLITADGPSHEVMNDKDFMLSHGMERPHSLLHGKSHRHNSSAD